MVVYAVFSLIFGGDTLCVVQIMNIQAMGGGLHLFGGLVCAGSCLGLMWLSESTQIC